MRSRNRGLPDAAVFRGYVACWSWAFGPRKPMKIRGPAAPSETVEDSPHVDETEARGVRTRARRIPTRRDARQTPTVSEVFRRASPRGRLPASVFSTLLVLGLRPAKADENPSLPGDGSLFSGAERSLTLAAPMRFRAVTVRERLPASVFSTLSPELGRYPGSYPACAKPSSSSPHSPAPP
jgi:hypothetical protein